MIPHSYLFIEHLTTSYMPTILSFDSFDLLQELLIHVLILQRPLITSTPYVCHAAICQHNTAFIYIYNWRKQQDTRLLFEMFSLQFCSPLVVDRSRGEVLVGVALHLGCRTSLSDQTGASYYFL
jgi:hypothetical protein